MVSHPFPLACHLGQPRDKVMWVQLWKKIESAWNGSFYTLQFFPQVSKCNKTSFNLYKSLGLKSVVTFALNQNLNILIVFTTFSFPNLKNDYYFEFKEMWQKVQSARERANSENVKRTTIDTLLPVKVLEQLDTIKSRSGATYSSDPQTSL